MACSTQKRGRAADGAARARTPRSNRGRTALDRPNPTLAVEMRPVGDLVPYANNARRHSDRQIGKIAKSIETFGFVNPVLIDRDGGVIAGHGRLAAAKRLGFAEVPTIRLEHMSEAEKRAYVLADNRLAELADWDEEMLRIEIGALAEIDVGGGLDFDIGVTGFETAEIDLLLDGPAPQAPDPADATLEHAQDGPPITRPGDLWILGEHRLLCGDALAAESYGRLMSDERARLVFTDPPYNVPISGHVCGLGAVKHREFAMATGEMSATEFTDFLETSLRAMAGACVDGAILYACIDWRHLAEMTTAATRAELSLLNICVWNKSNAGMGSFYRSKHELVCVFKHGHAAHVNTVELGRHGRYRTNVWDYAGVNTFRRGRMDDLAAHPTVKPTALVADAIKDASRRGDIVLDGFGGSGTTLLAAERTGRRARLVELDPGYVDVVIRRWQALTGKTAIHEAIGRSFTDCEAAAQDANGAMEADHV